MEWCEKFQVMHCWKIIVKKVLIILIYASFYTNVYLSIWRLSLYLSTIQGPEVPTKCANGRPNYTGWLGTIVYKNS